MAIFLILKQTQTTAYPWVLLHSVALTGLETTFALRKVRLIFLDM